MSESERERATRKGVEGAWDFWLSQHDVSTPEIIEVAVREAWERWLDQHTDEIVRAIAEQVSLDQRDIGGPE